MSAEAVDVVSRIQEALVAGDVVEGLHDPEAQARLRAMLAELTDRDFEVVMIGPDYLPQRLETSGPDGFREAWLDWTSPFESFSVEVEEVLDAGDKVVSLVRQRGRTRTGGVEIQSEAAAVWTVRDGRLARVEFHLDRAQAMRSAGLEPGQS
jgi:ketosteroid isomerase-like protein